MIATKTASITPITIAAASICAVFAASAAVVLLLIASRPSAIDLGPAGP